MAEFLSAAALLVLLTVAGGLLRVLRGPGLADRVMAAQLLGTGGIAVLLLAAVAAPAPALADAALTLAVLAAFAAVAMVRAAPRRDPSGEEPPP
jgi:multicomponent Na+:H+ antiporter subunit F